MNERLENSETRQYAHWVRPHLQYETGEIERVVRDFLHEPLTEENIRRVISILETAPIVDLSDAEWAKLENTESFDQVRPGFLEDAERITATHNAELAGVGRSVKDLVAAFSESRDMEAPTILRNADGVLHLVSGNTRLMISRALGIRPKVIIGEL